MPGVSRTSFLGPPDDSATVQLPQVAIPGADERAWRHQIVESNDASNYLARYPHDQDAVWASKRTAQVELRWQDLLSGDAALAVALSASLSQQIATKAAPRTSSKSPIN